MFSSSSDKFVGQNAGKRFKKIRRQSCSFLLWQGEREFLCVSYRSQVRGIIIGLPIEQRLPLYTGDDNVGDESEHSVFND